MFKTGFLNDFGVPRLPNVSNNEGSKNKLQNMAINNVKDIKYPIDCVPPKEENANIEKPKNNTDEE